MYLVAIIVMNALFALALPFGKLALQYTDAFFLTGLRMVIAGALLACYAGWNGFVWKKILPGDYSLFARTTLYFMFLAFIPEAWALGYISSLKANMMWSLLPFVTAFFSYYLISERLTKRKILGMIIGAAGIIPILLTSDDTACGVREIFRVSLPEVMMLLAIGATAYGWFLVNELDQKGYSLVQINSLTMLMAGFMSLAFGLGCGYSYGSSSVQWPIIFGYAFLIAVLGNLSANLLYAWLLRHYTPTFLSFSSFLAPIFGVIYGVVFMHEHFYYRYITSFVLIITGLAIFYRDELKAQIKFSEALD